MCIMKNLFKVFLDNYEVFVVANNDKEAEDHCFKFLDFDKISISKVKQVKSNDIYPYFVRGKSYAS